MDGTQDFFTGVAVTLVLVGLLLLASVGGASTVENRTQARCDVYGKVLLNDTLYECRKVPKP